MAHVGNLVFFSGVLVGAIIFYKIGYYFGKKSNGKVL
jgi:membrane protein DedA with SNARE-associated domain